MTARSHPNALATWLATGSLALLPMLGCATKQPNEDAEMNLKKARSHYDIAVDHVQNGRLELGLRELVVAERLDPGNPRIQHGLAMAYLQKGKLVEAEQHLLRAVEIRPDYQDARFNLSTLYLNQGRYEACVEHSQILYDDPTFPSSWRALTNWGWAAYKLGRVEEARRHLEYSRDSNRRYWPTLLNLGILEAEQGHKAEAIRNFTALLELEPGPSANAEANYRLAEIYVSLGKREQAVGHLRTAVVKAPSDPWGKKSEEYLQLLR
jgi:tetratricopeptide (TPR) repeat protein